jgi:hypothetical protein
LRENPAALATQDYPDYELIVVAHSARDIRPACFRAVPHVVLAPGDDLSSSAKVRNLRR